MRSLTELIDTNAPGWPLVQGLVRQANKPVKVLPRDPARAEAVLYGIQVTTRSPLGAIAYETGGILVDHGWLRILGSGHPKLPRDLFSWNRLDRPNEQWFPQLEMKTPDGRVSRIPGVMLVADDAVGGFYLLNGGIFPSKPGDVVYLPPDAIEWYDTKLGYTQFINWALTGDLAKFYEACRWSGWESDCDRLLGDRSYNFYPPLWAKHSNLDERSRRDIPVEEALGMYIESRKQMGSQPPGQ